MAVHYLDARAPRGTRLYAIGDVHGRFDLLEQMHGIIRTEIATDRPKDWRIVHVGDYVDRGPDSRAVIAFLIEATDDSRVVALCGNHDAAFLDFVDNPDHEGLFARYGGRQTAESYGIEGDFSSPETAAMTARELRKAMPASHLDFLRALPKSVGFGDFFFCHAGIRPGIALARQTAHDLIWIRREFLDHPGLHPKVVVHGHTPQPEVEVMPNRVNLDTMAYETGRLSALVVDGKNKRFLEVTD